ncbi:MAG: polyribonucleotide nucleotidyltransferase, partial [candidate division NC10 bacterium]
MTHRFETVVGGKPLSIETGSVARQADGAAWVRYGDTVVLVTAVAAKQAREGIDFFPLTVDYQERAYAAGKIPGGFFKREGRPRDAETVASRLIDRPIRPLFPKGYRRDVQIIATVLSADMENDPDVLAIVGASAALAVSPIPFLGPIGAVRVGRVDGQFVLNPTYGQLERSDLDLVIAGTREGVVMVEAWAREAPEEVVLEAIAVGHKALADLCRIQEQFQKAAGKPKTPFTPSTPGPALAERVAAACREPIRARAAGRGKEVRADPLAEVRERTVAGFAGEPPEVLAQVRELVEKVEKEEMRRLLLERGIRADGRTPDAIRPIRIEV